MKHVVTIPFILSIAACTERGAQYQPVLDGQPAVAFQSDLTACQNLAHAQNQFDQETAGAVVLGAGAGAILGEIDEDDALGGAVIGVLAGGVASAVNATERREAIVIECLRGRGHPVVG
ncbi:MAG: glycine zipper family protein [Roseobacter sp.]